MAAFKVAAFEFAEPGAAPTAALPDGPAVGVQDGGRFWKGLLEEGFTALEMAKQAEQGKGRRRRKQARPGRTTGNPDAGNRRQHSALKVLCT